MLQLEYLSKNPSVPDNDSQGPTNKLLKFVYQYSSLISNQELQKLSNTQGFTENYQLTLIGKPFFFKEKWNEKYQHHIKFLNSMKTKIILRIYMKSFIFKDSNCFNLTQNISSPAFFIKLYIKLEKERALWLYQVPGPQLCGAPPLNIWRNLALPFPYEHYKPFIDWNNIQYLLSWNSYIPFPTSTPPRWSNTRTYSPL